jgi:hypothetical protein
MFKGKTTLLFWCGLSVLVMAVVQLLGNIGFVWAQYVSYSRYSPLPPILNPVDTSVYLGGIVRGLAWSIIWSIFIAIGLYIAKSGVKKEATDPKTG